MTGPIERECYLGEEGQRAGFRANNGVLSERRFGPNPLVNIPCSIVLVNKGSLEYVIT